MNREFVKEKLYEAVSKFFAEAMVIWTEQLAVRPKLPYITLKLGDVDRTTFPIDDEEERIYPCGTKFEINLYTNGKAANNEENSTGNYINTAVSDMMEFSNFIESDYMVDFFSESDISVLLMPPIRDLTELQNESKYRYRAMAEFDVTFNFDASGRYGIKGIQDIPNSSGGGNEEMVREITMGIENVEINKR